jgi:hypothetical protein
MILGRRGDIETLIRGGACGDHGQVLVGDHSLFLAGWRRRWDEGEGPGMEEELGQM